jgi:hypothetical protein
MRAHGHGHRVIRDTRTNWICAQFGNRDRGCTLWCKTLQPVNDGDRRVWEWPLMVGVDPSVAYRLVPTHNFGDKRFRAIANDTASAALEIKPLHQLGDCS